MSASTPQLPIDLINQSGFPFQLGVKHEIERTSNEHRWKVAASEHRWSHDTEHSSGFIDLVMQHDTIVIVRMIVECKRTKDGAQWIFLTPSARAANMGRMSFFGAATGPNWRQRAGWIDLIYDPETPEAEFCTIHREEDGKRPMLERLADTILPAAEAVAIEEFGHMAPPPTEMPQIRVYLPAIITNAKLLTATFDPKDVDLETGRLREDACQFTEVPLVRFRKGLHSPSARVPKLQLDPRGQDKLNRINEAGERTVLIFTSASLAATLGRIKPNAPKRLHNEWLLSLLGNQP